MLRTGYFRVFLVFQDIKMTNKFDILNDKFDDFKKRLSEIVKEEFIESWLQKPNAAFNNRKPIDLINDNNYEPLYSMIYRLGSGEPSS